MCVESPIQNLRKPIRWRRIGAIVVLLTLPIAVLEWPWSFLPLRWRYSEIRRTSEVVTEIDDLARKLRRLPTREELMEATKDPYLTKSLNYEAGEKSYRLVFVCGFDCGFQYDSQEGRWK